jgi:peptidoglycan hydrolase-like protein with peptidoglycan-binding domain
MTAMRRAAVGVLTVLLLAVSAAAVGYALRQPTGRDIAGPVAENPSPVAHDAPPVDEPVTQPVAQPAVEPPPALPHAKPTRSQQQPMHVMEPGRVLLSRGDSGMAVRDLQARLAALAWYFSRPDGQYDDETVAAVRGFQDKRKIPVTGKVDQRTLDRLHAMTGEPTRDQMGLHNKPGPLDARCKTGRVLCIDKTSRTLRWVVDGKVLKTVDVRFGASATPTREGSYSVYLKSRDHVSQLYDSAMPFAMFFSGGQAVHYSSDFAATGYYGASHGCVNVRDYDAVAWLYDQVNVGDRVVVYWS